MKNLDLANGLYIHIPFCIQKCHYCDFATAPLGSEQTHKDYIDLLCEEILSVSRFVPFKKINSLYFGGGTPSAIQAQHILTLLKTVANAGYELAHDAEITIEINPGTVSKEKLTEYLAYGLNRFSVGVQSFNDSNLKVCGREHSADESRKTLELLNKNSVNYSFDLLYGLPQQRLSDLDADLKELCSYSPPHVSIYNLTVPDKHPLNKNRADDEIQVAMGDLIDTRLSDENIYRYEISNFAKSGQESRHNSIYWTGGNYWGFGLSAHSYIYDRGPHGSRYWNMPSVVLYQEQVKKFKTAQKLEDCFSKNQMEQLVLHEALTDFFHTRLRRVAGFSQKMFETSFGLSLWPIVQERLQHLMKNDLIRQSESGFFALTRQGRALSNRVFLDLTFLQKDTST